MGEERDGKERKEKAADVYQKISLTKSVIVRRWNSSRLFGGVFFVCAFAQKILDGCISICLEGAAAVRPG